MPAYTLNGLPLESMQWEDQYAWQPCLQESTRNLAGYAVSWSGPQTGGQPITLTVQDGVTWLTQAEVDGINAIAQVPGATYEFVWNDARYTVMFRHQEPPAVQFVPIAPRYDKFFGVIKLITV